jgi:8-oxo-dGTP pyrophosphatase MutT (NUDIX family)
VREFRSPAATPDGFVHELPGGSGDESEPVLQAAAEVEEETGLKIDAGRLRSLGARQVAGTVSAHRAHVFAAEITDEEVAWLREHQGVPNGGGGGERTWIELATYAEIREQRLVDWATLGMIAQALGA